MQNKAAKNHAATGGAPSAPPKKKKQKVSRSSLKTPTDERLSAINARIGDVLPPNNPGFSPVTPPDTPAALSSFGIHFSSKTAPPPAPGAHAEPPRQKALPAPSSAPHLWPGHLDLAKQMNPGASGQFTGLPANVMSTGLPTNVISAGLPGFTQVWRSASSPHTLQHAPGHLPANGSKPVAPASKPFLVDHPYLASTTTEQASSAMHFNIQSLVYRAAASPARPAPTVVCESSVMASGAFLSPCTPSPATNSPTPLPAPGNATTPVSSQSPSTPGKDVIAKHVKSEPVAPLTLSPSHFRSSVPVSSPSLATEPRGFPSYSPIAEDSPSPVYLSPQQRQCAGAAGFAAPGKVCLSQKPLSAAPAQGPAAQPVATLYPHIHSSPHLNSQMFSGATGSGHQQQPLMMSVLSVGPSQRSSPFRSPTSFPPPPPADSRKTQFVVATTTPPSSTVFPLSVKIPPNVLDSSSACRDALHAGQLCLLQTARSSSACGASGNSLEHNSLVKKLSAGAVAAVDPIAIYDGGFSPLTPTETILKDAGAAMLGAFEGSVSGAKSTYVKSGSEFVKGQSRPTKSPVNSPEFHDSSTDSAPETELQIKFLSSQSQQDEDARAQSVPRADSSAATLHPEDGGLQRSAEKADASSERKPCRQTPPAPGLIENSGDSPLVVDEDASSGAAEKLDVPEKENKDLPAAEVGGTSATPPAVVSQAVDLPSDTPTTQHMDGSEETAAAVREEDTPAAPIARSSPCETDASPVCGIPVKCEIQSPVGHATPVEWPKTKKQRACTKLAGQREGCCRAVII